MILFFKNIFKERIWGSRYFKDVLGYNMDDNLYGEMWSASAHPEGDSIIINEPFYGYTLSEVYKNHKELFGTTSDEFPLMVKLIHTNADLSVQVHPDDDYAREVENQFGKTECWYFLNNPKNPIVLGHNAKSKEEIKRAIENGSLESLLKKVVVRKNDFVLINAKTIHALTEGLLVVEIQQSSDVTYRLYDYNRKDKNGKYRELHIDKALDVINVPDEEEHKVYNYDKINGVTNILDCPKFKCDIVEINNDCNIKLDCKTFNIITVIEGAISISDHMLSIGESAIALKDEEILKLVGKGRVIISHL